MRNIYVHNHQTVLVEIDNRFYVADLDNDFAAGAEVVVDRDADILDWIIDADNPVHRKMIDYVAAQVGLYAALTQYIQSRLEVLAEAKDMDVEERKQILAKVDEATQSVMSAEALAIVQETIGLSDAEMSEVEALLRKGYERSMPTLQKLVMAA